jgi:hypothetical protein
MKCPDLKKLGVATALICCLAAAISVIAMENDENLASVVHREDHLKLVPAQLNYQGYLVDAADSSAVTSTLEMTFRLFDSETKSAELWSETHPSVEVSNGIFQVLLGSTTPFPTGLFDGSTLWLQTEVGTEVLSPRKPLVSVAYSVRSDEADYAAEADHATSADQATSATEAQLADSSDWADDAEHAVHADTADVCPGFSAWIVDGDDVYRTAGNVGIGTDSPSYTLDVDGTVGASAFYGDGSNLTGISGTADNDWTIDGDTIYHDNGPVGIGTTMPTAPLTIGAITGDDILFTSGGSNADIKAETEFRIGTSSSQPLHLITNNNFRLTVLSGDGHVGIGTTSPAYPLDVNGAVNAATYYGDGSNLTGISGSADNDWTINGDTVYHEIGPVGIGTTTPTARLTIQTAPGYEIHFPSTGDNADIMASISFNLGTLTGHPLVLLTNNSYRLLIDGSGNVGIGTITPAHKLDVNGDVNATTYYGDGSNLTGISGTTDNDWTIAGSDMYSAVSGDVGIGTSSPIGKLHVVGSNGNYAQFGRTSYAVYGVNPNNNNYGYFGGSYGAYGSDIGSGNYGYMGSSSYGLYGRHNSSNNYGYVGGGTYAAYFRHNSSGNFCIIGSSEEGVLGKHGDTNNYGNLGTYSWGVYGYHADSLNYGGLGGEGYGAYGFNSGDNKYGALGTNDYGVYYSGGIGGTGKGGLIVRTQDGPREMSFHQTTESWCEDFGSGQIFGGRAKVPLAEDFRQTVTVSADHPLKVFITPNERFGEWWVEKGTSGFTLVAPDAPDGSQFDYRVAAKRKGYEDQRLILAPAGYGDHFLYPDISDVPPEYRWRWHSSIPNQETEQ